MFKYSINLAWSDEDGCYVATIPEFPYLSAFGDTPEEAVGDAKVASEGIIEVMKEDGDTIPEPQKIKTYSGQTRLRMPKSLHERLSVQAEREKVSFNTYVVSLLEGKSSREDAFFESQKMAEKVNAAVLEKAGTTLIAMVDKRIVGVFPKDYSTDFSHDLPTFSQAKEGLKSNVYQQFYTS